MFGTLHAFIDKESCRNPMSQLADFGLSSPFHGSYEIHVGRLFFSGRDGGLTRACFLSSFSPIDSRNFAQQIYLIALFLCLPQIHQLAVAPGFISRNALGIVVAGISKASRCLLP